MTIAKTFPGSNQKVDERRFLLPTEARITSSVPLTAMERLIEIELAQKRVLGHQPGQFVEVSILGVGEAPISIATSPLHGARFQLCVRKVGNVTGALHELSVGSLLGIRGPFGRGFSLEEMREKDLFIVAGGLGLVPLRSLIQYIFERRDEFGKITLLIGAKRPEEILFRNEIQEWKMKHNCEIHITVDRADGDWKENVGVVTVLFNRVQVNPENTVAVVVGPPVMFKFVLLELLARKIPNRQIFVSLERRMKCGIGKCGHCQMGGYYVCREGPVFSYAEIEDCEEAFGWKRK